MTSLCSFGSDTNWSAKGRKELMMMWERERQVAIDAVAKTCHLCEQVRAEELSGKTMEKADKSPVTVADFATQAVISLEISSAFPEDLIMAEEHLAGVTTDLKEKIVQHVGTSYADLGDEKIFSAIDRCTYHGGPNGRFWVLDPVDGTKGFLRGDQYAIALALIEDGKVVLGVLGCPNLPLDLEEPDGPKGCIYIATENEGARMRSIDGSSETLISVSETGAATKGSFCESFESRSTSHSSAARIAEVLGIKTPPIRIDSQCKYGIVARGDASIYLRLPSKAGYEEKIWDHAAGWLVVREAGGTITDINNRPLDFTKGLTLSENRGIVATNGKIHTQVIAGVRQVLESE
jgi:3'(2'), 5'-bisphosphate nucleotidase